MDFLLYVLLAILVVVIIIAFISLIVAAFVGDCDNKNGNCGRRSRHATSLESVSVPSVNGSKNTMVMIHGGGGGFDQGLVLSRPFRSQFNIFSVSRPGYLGSPLELGPNVPAQADAIAKAMKEKSIEKAVIYGFSAGADVALSFALRHPDMTQALVLTSMGVAPNFFQILAPLQSLTDEQKVKAVEALYIIEQQQSVIATGALLEIDSTLSQQDKLSRIQFVLDDTFQTQFSDAFITTLLTLPAQRLSGTMQDLRNIKIFWKDNGAEIPFEQIKVPTWIVQSNNDSLGNYSQAQNASTRIPSVYLKDFITVKNSGHILQLGEFASAWENQLTNEILAVIGA